MHRGQRPILLFERRGRHPPAEGGTRAARLLTESALSGETTERLFLMGTPIRIGIAGYGNLGRGVETALARNPDMKLVGVFSRRDPSAIALRDPAVPVHALARAADFADAIDVMILCGGSKSDLPEQGPALAALFNTVDSFDTHARIPEYFDAVDAAARGGGHVALISVGWDPGLFSVERLLGEAILPEGATYTFWGK